MSQELTIEDRRLNALAVIASGLLASGDFMQHNLQPAAIDARRVAAAAAEVLSAIEEKAKAL
jgi:hypothetical protein